MSFVRLFLLIGLLALMTACATATEPAESTPTAPTAAAPDPTPTAPMIDEASTAPTPLKVVTLPFLSFAPFYIGVEEGYFAAQNLEIELVNMTVQRDIVPALASGQVDVAAGLVSAGVLNTIARGGELKLVADKGYIDPNGCDNYAIIARQGLVDSADFNSAAAWNGAKVDVVPATWLEYYLDTALASVGADPSLIAQSDTPAPAEPEALAQGAIDFTVNNEPWVVILGRGGHQPVLTPVTQLMPDSQSAVLFYGPNLLNGDPDVGERFMTAYLQSVRQYNAGKTERNLEILLKYIQIDPALLADICWPALRDDGSVFMEDVLAFQAWAVDQAIMDEPLSAEQIYDARFIESANAALDALP